MSVFSPFLIINTNYLLNKTKRKRKKKNNEERNPALHNLSARAHRTKSQTETTHLYGRVTRAPDDGAKHHIMATTYPFYTQTNNRTPRGFHQVTRPRHYRMHRTHPSIKMFLEYF